MVSCLHMLQSGRVDLVPVSEPGAGSIIDHDQNLKQKDASR